MSGYTGVSDYNSATRAWKDRVYLEEQAKINNINYVDGTEVLNAALDNFKGTAARFSSDLIKDANNRLKYQRGIKRISDETLKAVKTGKMTVAQGVEYANQMRDIIMAETRKVTSPQGLAVATSIKSTPKSLEYYFDKYAQKLYDKDYKQLTSTQQSKIQYAVIESSGRSNIKISTLNKRLKIMGKVCWVITAAFAVSAIVEADNKIREAHIQTGTIAGGLVGGAAAGALGMSFFCGPGAPFCAVAVIIGLVGSVAGSAIGAWIGEEIYEEADEFIEWGIF